MRNALRYIYIAMMMGVPLTSNLKSVESTNIEKYQGLRQELKRTGKQDQVIALLFQQMKSFPNLFSLRARSLYNNTTKEFTLWLTCIYAVMY